jgi:site-specific DNA-methyltransferase (adenine-specific)
VIKWSEKTVKVSDLKPFERNPRRISQDAFNRLKKSLAENGYHQRIIATKDLRIVGGHQRIKALKELGLKQIAVLVPDKELSAEQFRRLLIQDNLPFGEWDFELLSADFSICLVPCCATSRCECAGGEGRRA